MDVETGIRRKNGMSSYGACRSKSVMLNCNLPKKFVYSTVVEQNLTG